MELLEIKRLADRIKANISSVIVGKDDITELVLMSFLCSGHILLEDVPGVGKTMLAKCLARSVDCGFKRVQFTPDLLPSDLTGINYFDQKQGEFIFRPGPIFTNIVLADEINRATPRTQSSMLECMEEGQVTVDGETRVLDKPFFVIATQNPIETRGTFPLPEAQLDRFFMRIRLGYPTQQEGKDILNRFRTSDPLKELQCVASAEEVTDAGKSFMRVKINDAVQDYIISIIEATRKNERISLGVSPRGGIALMRAAQMKAVFEMRDFVIPDDVKQTSIPVLAHRIILKGHAITGGTLDSEAVVADILKKVPVPTEEV